MIWYDVLSLLFLFFLHLTLSLLDSLHQSLTTTEILLK